MGRSWIDGFYNGQEHWKLNPNNPIVAKMLYEDEQDSDDMGLIGITSDELEVESVLFDISSSLHIPLSDVITWSLNQMRLALAYKLKKIQQERAFVVYSEMKAANNNGK